METRPREKCLNLSPPVTKLGQGNIFRSVCQEFCPQGGDCMAGGHAWWGHAWQGVCVVGDVCGRGPWIHGRGHAWQGCVCGRGHAWQGACMHGWGGVCVAGGMHGRGSSYMAWGHAWSGGVHGMGGMHGRGHAWQGGMHSRRCAWQGECVAGGMCGIRSMSGQYASYWNAFLLNCEGTALGNTLVFILCATPVWCWLRKRRS